MPTVEETTIEEIRQNVVESPASYVGNARDAVLVLCDQLDALLKGGPIPDAVDQTTCFGIIEGVRNAPAGVMVYHEQVHLLLVLEAYDLLSKPKSPPVPAAPEEL